MSKGRELAQSLRGEGRADDALVIDTLVRAVDPAPSYFTTGQVARRLGVSRQTVVNWIKQGYLPGERVGVRMMVSASAFDRYAEIEKVLDALDAERPPLTPEDAAEVVGRGREHWTWVGREWRKSELKESAADREHFIDLCRLIGECVERLPPGASA